MSVRIRNNGLPEGVEERSVPAMVVTNDGTYMVEFRPWSCDFELSRANSLANATGLPYWYFLCHNPSWTGGFCTQYFDGIDLSQCGTGQITLPNGCNSLRSSGPVTIRILPPQDATEAVCLPPEVCSECSTISNSDQSGSENGLSKYGSNISVNGGFLNFIN